MAFVLSTLFCFAIIESIRYPYYFLKQRGSTNNPIAKLLGALRYNAFIVVYPIGAMGEVLVAFGCLPAFLRTEPRPYSLAMPNPYNFAWDIVTLIYCMPIIYITTWPLNYKYMFVQRSQYYKALN
mmetsp:Transcript_5464/g.4158  ORF Transcript_5464/g.4158 Transcript_5464/m.4158 type:complete len:125 (+) Transcript_5464:303-677(+)|eukprot:CAMPEP_0202962850 /NCGR_PEP_ID=MMETSP1396-20130829/6899_1 /ASSEMBLY_ACC=CAM_ASM_000872 /TAXON_ID= /ORGANISM="Pseudokeronopsis sp., Strain Brazil" /LENGTH=124 /DNA_ID=CAMNT_0049683665 /DNA_START=303 /DNA_END=677 /DNA_ORIENTATION=-